MPLPGVFDDADPWRELPVPPDPPEADDLLGEILELFDAEVEPDPADLDGARDASGDVAEDPVAL